MNLSVLMPSVSTKPLDIRKRHLLCLTFLAICLGMLPVAAGQRIAITSEAEASKDRDFKVQGEYVGLMRQGADYRSMGLQVCALGKGEFSAQLFPGGLPGAGWDRSEPLTATGSWASEGPVRLVGDSLNITIEGETASVLGDVQGRMRKTVRRSPTMGKPAPQGATILFAGTLTDELKDPQLSDDGLLLPGTQTTQLYGDFSMHIEFRTPYMPNSRGQQRGNSGVYIQRRYEVQILDSFGFELLPNGCAALYRQKPGDLNMSLPPLVWQTYDIYFKAAQWDDAGTKLANARISVFHNGVPVHLDREIVNKTGAGRQEAPEPGEILFQNHTDPVRFRNMWLVTSVDDMTRPPFAEPEVSCQTSQPCKPRVRRRCLGRFRLLRRCR